MPTPPRRDHNDDGNFVHGCVVALILSALFWTIVVWLIFGR